MKRFDLLSQLGCCICGRPAQIHHLTGIKYKGMGQKADDKYTIPLCMDHHTGANGIHTLGKRPWEEKYATQEYLLELVEQRLKKLLLTYELGK